ncbi:Peptidase M43 pregnancy-associated plasma-A [Macrophomina phaseolina MS6]|uniref:Peptidase M43 pregnancy-associated plasma-A n=1 Tax=Macrophomina phaseolina (strain MS6) TaxID=1126212 RepID=K2QWY2_MACPH|nr:Peptidase M43 pregnancy-associated plasma-A [Macrophomina phaseolina MS6]
MVTVMGGLAAVAVLVSSAAASSTGNLPRGCATEVSEELVLRSRSAISARPPTVELGARQADSTNTTAVLSFYFHIILAENNHTTDFITDDLLARQLDILNDGFVAMGYKFDLIETTRIVNDTWFYNATQYSPIETEMKTALRKGDRKALNTYVVGFPDTSDSAWASLPATLGPLDWPDGRWLIDDGVVLHNSVLLNGSNWYGWNKGKSLVHEAGHWVGLYHTFSGGCEANYDYIDDTPLEAVPESSISALGGCPIGRDSCPDDPGLDPIHNFMDYTGDDCRTEFTPGQVAFAHSQMEMYRQVYV